MAKVAEPKNERELLLRIHDGLYGDGNGNPGFFRMTDTRLQEIEEYIKKDQEREYRRAETCPHTKKIEALQAIRSRDNRKKNVIETIKAVGIASPGIAALLAVFRRG